MAIQIAPSILSADFANLERDIAAVSTADLLHVDVMDAHFVPNLTLGLPIVERIAQVSSLPVDTHLMIENPDHWAARYAEAGAASVTFHYEAAKNPVAIARDLRALGVRASVALKPGTDASEILDDLKEFDMVLVMTVEPGFGGQAFMPEMLPKIEAIRAAVDRGVADGSLAIAPWIQVDGGIAPATAHSVTSAGADVLVAGSAVYGSDDRAAAIASLREVAQGPETIHGAPTNGGSGAHHH
ncbi:ribulose-phosphate 3-epimerase [Demequina aurantiaca]|uniref:ribulose-phosphate 3-epimerase n=1 Tax=Demequina aurantiaca TaxID=676200 RepID=UPI000784DBE7|nr:ribulose-phosphate 3-epimerase [Demequina aurantiaca]